MKRLSMAERMEKCAVAVPDHFVRFMTEYDALDLPPFSKDQLGNDLKHIYECIEPKITWWMLENIRQTSVIKVKVRMVPCGPLVRGVQPRIMEGRWFVFGNETDALMFKMGMSQWN